MEPNLSFLPQKQMALPKKNRKNVIYCPHHNSQVRINLDSYHCRAMEKNSYQKHAEERHLQKTPPFWMSASEPHLILPEATAAVRMKQKEAQHQLCAVRGCTRFGVKPCLHRNGKEAFNPAKELASHRFFIFCSARLVPGHAGRYKVSNRLLY